MEILEGIKWGLLLWVIFSQAEWVINKWDRNRREFNPCKKCITFFSILIITLNPFTAATSAFIMWWIEKNNVVQL